MKRTLSFFAIALSMFAHADTNALEQARAAYLAARDANMEARKAAGLTNRVRQTASNATILTKSQKRFFENRRICVRRDTTTIPGSVITTWFRGGKLDTKAPAVITNVLHAVQGATQDNPLQGRIAELLERATSAEARAARAERLKEWLAEQRDKALLPTTRAIYQAIIDKMEEQ